MLLVLGFHLGAVFSSHLFNEPESLIFVARIVDMHSHLGVDSAPALNGASDGNSHKGPILPWLRSIDGINTHDDAYRLSISGGVTTSLVLPGSANAIGLDSLALP